MGLATMNRVALVLAFWSAVAVQARPGDLLGGGGFGDSFDGGYGGGISGGHGGGLGGLGGGGGGSSGGSSGGHGGGGGSNQLTVVPDISAFEGLNYPSLGLQELGTIYEGQIPSQTVKVSNTIAVKVPQPYPVKIPHNIPVPYPVAKPYPVPVPQFIKVPHPVPVEVIKKVPVPLEVPKPYPVSADEFKSSQGDSGSGGYGGGSYGGGSFGGHQQLSEAELPHTSYGEPIQGGYSGSGGYDSYASQSQDSGYDSVHEGQADQSVGYPAIASALDNQEQSGSSHDS